MRGEDTVSTVIKDSGFTVESIRRLREITGWSIGYIFRMISRHAPAQGALLRLDQYGAVMDSVSLLDFPTAPKRSDQHEMTIYRQACSNHIGVTILKNNEVQIKYSTGSYSNKLYAQGIIMDGSLVVLALVGNAPWIHDESPKQSGFAYQYGSLWTFTCEKCGGVRYHNEGDICPKCNKRRCPRGHCKCEHERTCASCYLTKSINQFHGDSPICNECADE